MEGKEKDTSVIIQAPPPKYEERKSSGGRFLMAAVIYGVMVTMLMVAVVVFGAIFYGKMHTKCLRPLTDVIAPSKVVKDTLGDKEGNTMERQMVQYEQDEVLVYHFSQPDSLVDGTILALDYKRSVTGVYIPESEACFIIGGIDHHLGYPFTVQGEEQDIDDGENDTQQNVQLSYVRADDFPVLDHNVLPRILHEYCMDREVNWLERDFDDDTLSREKRQLTWGTGGNPEWYGGFGNGGLTGGLRGSNRRYSYDVYGVLGGSFNNGGFSPSAGIGIRIRW